MRGSKELPLFGLAGGGVVQMEDEKSKELAWSLADKVAGLTSGTWAIILALYSHASFAVVTGGVRFGITMAREN